MCLALMIGAALPGCSSLRSGKLVAPAAFGFELDGDRLYVEPGTTDAARARLRDALARAERAVQAAYGNVRSRPAVHACLSEACYRSFGGSTDLARAVGSRILLSPRGLTWHLIAHEWSHVELHQRLSFAAWLRTPQWFDEGVAVAVSEAPEHSEQHRQTLIDAGVALPTREELHTFHTLRDWLDAIRRYSEHLNVERRSRGEPEIRPVYAAAGHELRAWLAGAGVRGLLQLIDRVNDGEEFMTVYRTLAPAGAAR